MLENARETSELQLHSGKIFLFCIAVIAVSEFEFSATRNHYEKLFTLISSHHEH